MKKIDINEENVQIYEKLYNSKKGICSNKDRIILNSIVIILILLTVLGTIMLGIGISSILPEFLISEIISTIISTMTGCFTLSAIITSVTKIETSYLMKKFKKEYPTFDTNIDENELEKELIKYSELSKNSKDTEKENLSCQQSNNNKISVNEQKAFLEQTKELIMQAELFEEKDDTNDAKNQKKIGSIK